MAKIVKLKKRVDLETVHTVYPITIPEGVIDPVSKKSVKTILVEKADHGYGEEETAKTLKEVESQKADHGYGEEETPKSLKEIDAQKADHGYGDEEPVKTLKEIDTNLVQLATNLSVSQAEQDASIKQIEQILSQSNLNHTAQVSSTGREIVSLPRTASNGGMQVKLEGLTAENLVINGDFRNGMTGWTKYSGGTSVIESGYVKYTPTSTVGAISNGFKQLSVGNKWYVRTIVKSSSPVAGSVGFAKSEAGVLLAAGNIGTSDTTISGILTIANADINEFVVGRPTTIQDIYIKNAYAINLTQIFGSGNEPDLATCDKMFSSYFEGRKNFVPTGRIRSVGKNLWFEPKAVNSFDSITLQCTVNDMGQYLKVTGPGTLLKKIYLQKGTYKLVLDGYTDSGSLGIVGIYFVGGTSLGSIVFGNSRSVKTSANIVISESGFYDVRYYPSNSSSTGHNMYVYSAMLVRSDASVTYEPYRSTSLYLTAPELRSNGLVKDEIRKGANGYELVKKVGVATLGSELITNAADREFSSDTTFWLKNLNAVIANGVMSVSNATSVAAGISSSILPQNKSYRVAVEIKSLSTGGVRVQIGVDVTKTLTTVGQHTVIGARTVDDKLRFYGNLAGQSFEIDNVSVKEVIPQEGAISSTSAYTELSNGTILYTLATPVITPISYGGVLNSAENGTVYHEPVVADAGVYSTKMDIFNIDYPISALEEIRVHSGGVDTYLDVSAAVIAADGESFTHPSLSDGDTVLFTYFFNKERVNGLLTATYYDGRYVIADSANGKFYKWGVKSTNGVPAINLTEV